jgi:chemotaxis protein histidine kinase CheA
VTASALDPAPGSGLASLTYSLDGSAWAGYTGAVTIPDGTHTLTLRAVDVAGNMAQASAGISVDTLAPQPGGGLSGTDGQDGWYISQIDYSAAASDATSGVDRIQLAVNGGGWVNYSGPVRFGDGLHSVQLRAYDVAGNPGSGATLSFKVDTNGPKIELPASWNVWDTAAYVVKDGGSSLSTVEVIISDPDGRWPKVAHTFHLNESRYESAVEWNRQFGDGTIAPPGDYRATVKATDQAGNSAQKSGTIHIPLIPVPPAIVAAPVSIEEDEEQHNQAEPVFPAPGAQSAAPAGAPAPKTIPKDFGSPASQPQPALPSSNVLFDAAAIAAVAGVTTYWAMKKREEEEARLAAEAARRAEQAAAEQAAARRRRTARERSLSADEKQAQKLKAEIAAVTQKEQKEWKAERYQQISQTDGYKNSSNKTQFMKQELENIKQQEAAYRKREREEAARLAAEEAGRKAQEEAAALEQALLAAQRAQQAANFDADMTQAQKLAALKATVEYQTYTANLKEWEQKRAAPVQLVDVPDWKQDIGGWFTAQAINAGRQSDVVKSAFSSASNIWSQNVMPVAEAGSQLIGGFGYQLIRDNLDGIAIISPVPVSAKEEYFRYAESLDLIAPDTLAFKLGRVAGGIAGVIQGIWEIATGTATATGGTIVSCGTVILCFGGGGASLAVGGALVLHGALVTVTSVAETGMLLHGLVMEASANNANNNPSANSSVADGFQEKLDNAKGHTTIRDLDAARRELNGEVVARKPDGTPYDHVMEVTETQNNLRNIIIDIQGKLGDPNTRLSLSQSEIDALEKTLGEASRLLDYTEQFVP